MKPRTSQVHWVYGRCDTGLDCFFQQRFWLQKSPGHLLFQETYMMQFSSVQQLSHVRLFVTPWTAARQASLSFTNSRSTLKLMPIESVMPSNHLIFCHPLLFLPPIFPSIRVFSNESFPHIRWPEYRSFSFSISPSNEHPGRISFRMDWLDLLALQGTLKSPPKLQFKASILWCSAFFIVQFSHSYMTTGKTIALTRVKRDKIGNWHIHCTVLSHSVVSDSLQPHRAHQAPLSMGILQARILEWIAMSSSRECSQLRDWTQVSHFAGGFFTVWATREAQEYWSGWSVSSVEDLPDPGNQTGVSCISGGFFTSWAIWEAWHIHTTMYKIDN